MALKSSEPITTLLENKGFLHQRNLPRPHRTESMRKKLLINVQTSMVTAWTRRCNYLSPNLSLCLYTCPHPVLGRKLHVMNSKYMTPNIGNYCQPRFPSSSNSIPVFAHYPHNNYPIGISLPSLTPWTVSSHSPKVGLFKVIHRIYKIKPRLLCVASFLLYHQLSVIYVTNLPILLYSELRH